VKAPVWSSQVQRTGRNRHEAGGTVTGTLKVNPTRVDRDGMVTEFRDEWPPGLPADDGGRPSRSLTVGDIAAGVMLGLCGFAVLGSALVVIAVAVGILAIGG
jgi:hypothetical protein